MISGVHIFGLCRFQVNEDDDEEHSSTRSKKKTVGMLVACCVLQSVVLSVSLHSCVESGR